MYHETGTATGVDDLLNKLATALAAHGWTVDRNATDGTGRQLQVHKTSAGYFTFRTYNNETAVSGNTQLGALFGLPATGYASGSSWFTQPGVPTWVNFGTQYMPCGLVAITGALASYHFFIDSATEYDCVYVFAEYPAGSWQHLGFGRLDTSRFGTVGGGQFMFGGATTTQTARPAPLTLFGPIVSSYSGNTPVGYVYVDEDSFTGWAFSDWTHNSTQVPSPRIKDTVFKSSSLWNSSPSAMNGRAPFRPIGVLITDDGLNFAVNTPMVLTGELPKIYGANIKIYNPGQTVNITTDTYIVFPFYKKSDADFNQFDPEAGTMWNGLAVRSN